MDTLEFFKKKMFLKLFKNVEYIKKPSQKTLYYFWGFIEKLK